MATASLVRSLSSNVFATSSGRLEETDGDLSQVLAGKGVCPRLKSTFFSPITKKVSNKHVSVRASGTLRISSVLDKSSGTGTSGQNNKEPLEPARAALERLFSQAQRHEERKLDPDYATETELEDAVAQIEKDLEAALGALRMKEEQLRDAENLLKEDRFELQKAKANFAQREKRLEAMQMEESGRQGEIGRLKKEVGRMAQDLKSANEMIKEKERQVKVAHAALAKVEEDFRKANSLLLERDQTLLKLTNQLNVSQKELKLASEREEEREVELKNLASLVKTQEVELKASREALKVKEVKLRETEKDIKARTDAWLGAQEEMKILERDLQNSKSMEGMTQWELENAKTLLADVQQELYASQHAVNRFRHDISEQKDYLGKSDKELESQRAVLRMRELELAQARREVYNSKEQLRLARAGYDRVSKKLQEQQQETDRMQVALTAGKEAVKDTISEMNTFKKQIRQKDAIISDAELQVHLKEAQRVGLKLELQQVRSELLIAHTTLGEKSTELESATRQVASLQAELVQVKGRLKEKEEELAKMSALLAEKDCTIAAMRADLTFSNEKLSEATSVVEQIAALSKSLAQSAANGLEVSVGDNEVLMQTNFELFAANRALLERELELQRFQEKENSGAFQLQALHAELRTVKESLLEKEVQLVSMRSALEQKNEELRKILDRWEDREMELTKLRQDVLDEARGLAGMKVTSPMKGNVKAEENDEPSLEQMELEVAKLEVETALCALQGLADLSYELMDECHIDGNFGENQTSEHRRDLDPTSEWRFGISQIVSQAEKVSEASTSEALEAAAEELAKLKVLKEQLSEKDAALELAKNAMDSLTRLTHKLVSEAGVTSADFDFAEAVGGVH